MGPVIAMLGGMYKVSVIMSTYNRAATLAASIESVLNQDFHDFFELIIVNDGSTDDSERIIKNYISDPRVRHHKIPNGGQAKALNFGIQKAKGDYIAFIDSDDEYHPHHLTTLFDHARKTSAEIVLGSFDIIYYGGQLEVVDYYNKGKLVPITEVECITGVLFGQREKIINAGGFEGDFLDIHFLEKVKKSNLRWSRCFEKTYRYHFGRCPDNLSSKFVTKYIG